MNNKKIWSSTRSVIMIDARVVGPQCDHGIACYTQELVSNIMKKDKESSFYYLILLNKNSCLNTFKSSKIVKFIYMKTAWSSILGQLELMWVIFKYKPTLFHAPSFVVPLLSGIKLIATVHDVNHIVLAKNYSFKQKLYYILLGNRLRKRSLVLTVSQFSKSEIIKHLKIEPTYIHSIYNGISSIFKPKSLYLEEELLEIKNKYNLPEKYIFTVGNSKPHKNLAALIEAYCEEDIKIPLVVLCNSSENLSSIVQKYDKLDSVIFLNSIEEQKELAIIYALCEFFIFPSLYEGFGFPPLEASACGVPVLTSNTSSLPETVGNSAYYFDPNSVIEIRKSLLNILNISAEEKNLKIEAGLLHAKKFSWKNTTQEILNKYNSLF